MMKSGTKIFLSLLLLAGPTAAAQAVTQTLSLVADVSGLDGTTGNQIVGNANISPPFSIQLAEGDTLDLTIKFLPGQSLTMVNPDLIWAFAYTNVGSFVDGQGTLSLLDASGTPFMVSNLKTDTESSYHFGQYFYDFDFPGGWPASLTFSGVRYVGTVLDYQQPGVTTRTYDRPEFSVRADSFSVAVGVPEPASWAMMIGGFALVGSAMRRRKTLTEVSFG